MPTGDVLRSIGGNSCAARRWREERTRACSSSRRERRRHCSLSVSVADMGPNGLGDAQVNDDDIVLLFNGHDHYNGLVSASIAEALS